MKQKIKDLGSITARTFKAWIANDPLRQAAVIAYFAIFSIPALLVLVFNVAGLVIEKEKISTQVVAQIQSAISEQAAQQVEKAVSKASQIDEGALSTIIGIVIILFGGTRVLVQFQTTLNGIWGVRTARKAFVAMLVKQLFSLGLILALGFLLVVSMAVSAAISIAGNWIEQNLAQELVILLRVVEFLFSFALLGLLFTLIFRYLPDVRPRWREVIYGALITTILFLLLKYAISFFFTKADPASVYGAAGFVVLIMLWVALCSMAVFFGAEFTKQYAAFYDRDVKLTKHAEKISEPDNSER